jgi:crotonobetainyl-CoA hydratase
MHLFDSITRIKKTISKQSQVTQEATMSSDEIIKTAQDGYVLEITLNRPPANAINRATSRAIYSACAKLQESDDLRVGIITGEGERLFSAGFDLKEAASDGIDRTLDTDPEHGEGPGGFAGITEFYTLTKPLIAAVNGGAIGGGFEIALACDLIVMAEESYFQLPEMKVGILPDGGGIQRLPKRVPHNVAVDMMLTGRRMYADEALNWGLAREVVPRDQLMETVRELAHQIASGAPLAQMAMKEVLFAIDGVSASDGLALTKAGTGQLPIYEKMIASEDAEEGPRAFAEKRDPVWQGK